MKVVVMTGGTRGIGYGLADSFLSLGCGVTISGRTSATVQESVERLSSVHKAGDVIGHPCNVLEFEQVQGLWDAAMAHFGRIDVWINNAGISHPQQDFWQQPAEQMKAVVDSNLVGAMYGARVALGGMLSQGFGSLYNLEGLGSDGRKVDGLTTYGTTKYGLSYLTDSLVRETRGTPVLVGALRPGMVVTDLITKQYEGRPEDWERAKPIFNILADRVETVTPWLARRMLANDRTGVRITWLTRPKATFRFLMASFRKRDLFG